MTEDRAFEWTGDPLYRDVVTDCVTEIPVLGIDVRFESNAPEIVDAADRAFAAWRVLDRMPELRGGERVTARFIMHEGDEGEAEHAPLRYRMPAADRVLLSTPGSMGVTDPGRRELVAYVTPALVADRDHFRYGVLEALTLALLTQLDRQPLHASALVRDGTALVLAGPSGVGKSTVAYAGMRAGLSVLAEDTVNIQLEPRLRIWGMPGYLHLPADARRHFPELADQRPTLLANGKEKLAIDLNARGAAAAVPAAERVGICVLSRGEAVAVERLDPERIEAELLETPELGFDVFADTIREGIRRLVRRGGWRLRLTADPEAAVPRIVEMLDALDAGA